MDGLVLTYDINAVKIYKPFPRLILMVGFGCGRAKTKWDFIIAIKLLSFFYRTTKKLFV